MTDKQKTAWEIAVEKKNLPCHCDQHLRDAGLPRPGTGKFGWKPPSSTTKNTNPSKRSKAQAVAMVDSGIPDELTSAAAELGINLDEVEAAA